MEFGFLRNRNQLSFNLETLVTFSVFQACAMCLGGAEGELAIAANTAIGLMLLLVVFVLGSFGGFIFYLGKRSRLVAAEDLAMNNNVAGRRNR